MVIDVIVVISFFLFVTSFFTNYFSSFIIEHSFFCDSFYSVTIFISLLFLRDCMPTFVLPSTVLEITLLFHLSIRSHYRTAHKSLAHIASLLSPSLQIFMMIRKLHHISERIASSSKEIIMKPEAKIFAHHLMHRLKRVISKKIKLIAFSLTSVAMAHFQ